jgi:leucyl-tRNA synthetase
MTPPTDNYDVDAVELKWQGLWREAEVEATPDPPAEGHGTYVFNTPPFTSGEAHMGHVRSCSIGDSYARFRRRQGDAVLYSCGFDAFGLPSELGALANEMTPAEWVERCTTRFQEQFTRLGFSMNWSRSFVSSDPEMYRWSQWMFLKLLERGLVYQQEAQVEWCGNCRTVLANLQVEDGTCWRCHEPVEFVNRSQWWLRRSAYNAESHFRLEELASEWSEIALAAQRASLGIVEGVEFDAQSLDGSSLTVFTTHPDSIEEGEFVLISPNHPDVEHWISSPEVAEQLKQARRGGGRREERRDASLWAVDSGGQVMAPGIADPIPVLISPSVDARFGPTAVLGIPSKDNTDKALREFVPKQGQGLAMKWKASSKSGAKPATRYRAGDFTISRQRAWGAPIPLIHCPDCGTVPVPLEDLPVRLPENLASEPGAGLDRFPDFIECACPSCGKPAKREADTLDCHIDASWSYIPPAVPPEVRSEAMFEHPDLPYWLPMKQLVQGADNGQFSLNMRLGAKMLRDIGVLEFLADGEPFAASLMHEMVQKDGRKMSKHLGNVVNPQNLVDEYGADAVRFAVLFAAAPSRAFNWNDLALRHCASFLSNFWSYAQPRLEARQGLPEAAEIDTSDKWRSRLALWCDKGVERVTQHFERLEPHQATRNIMRFADRVQDFEKRVVKARGELSEADEDALAIALLQVVALLAPIAPHMAEELWRRAGREGFVCQAPWPGASGPVGERQRQPVKTGAPS